MGNSVNRRSVMYMQYLEHLNFDSVDELEQRLEEYYPKGSNVEWAYIVHDKDVSSEDGSLIRPHVHVMLYNSDKFSVSKLKEIFKESKQQYFEYFKNKLAGFMYLVHAGKADSGKYQYDLTDVVTNFDYVGYISERHHISTRIDEILLSVSKCDITFQDIMNDEEMSMMYINHKNKFESALKLANERRKRIIEEQGINKTVVFVYSDDKRSGTGKTFYAKHKANEYAKRTGKTVYETSSSNDPFQDYRDEEIVILDDIRPSDFEVNDMLKLLDNNQITSSRSRYSNKTILADLIIITSIYTPTEFFERMINVTNEPIDQFIRRITYAAKVVPKLEKSELKKVEVSVMRSERLDNPIEIKNPITNTVDYTTYFRFKDTQKKS